MPRLSVYFVRASLLYLLLGFTIGGLMLANKGVIISPVIWSLLPLHIEFAFVGWMIQLAMGVAFWILPRFRQAPIRGNERLSWLAFFLLNIGIFLAVMGFLFKFQIFTLVGRGLELLGLVTFAFGNWKRIKPFDT
ncbi:MAG: hypothetical protein QM730_27645 [Anaerolineales bacterium]